MATMNVSLPAAMKAWAEEQAETGRYSNTSDYVRDLIRRDQERANKVAALQRLIDEAEEGGPGDKSMGELLAEARRKSGERRGL